MGRFRDLWASGKFAIQRKQEFEDFRQHEAMDLMKELSPELAVPESSKEIFNALKSKRGQETGRWLKGLVPETIDKPMVTEASNASAFEDLVVWIDALFSQFTDLAFEFNKGAVGTELFTSYQKPTVIEKKSDDVWYKPVLKTYQGRLSTRPWALVVRGREGKISIFLLPSAMVIAFDSEQVSEEELPPFMEVLRKSEGNGHVWTIGGEVAPMETIPHLAKEVFGDLIRVSSGVMSESELFASHDEHPALGDNLAVGYQKPVAQPEAAPSKAVASAKHDTGEMNVFEACDLVDEIIDRELKKLYQAATQVKPGTPEAGIARKQISAVEAFRAKLVDAYKEFTHTTQHLADNESKEPAQPAPELAK